ncbi:hypothetical protein NIES267_71310 (plasmid) [Calothrix parasitica NIES-267]|uniref:CobQ/CobB/MinD/ParA nucleotide binding domain-containing protein n=1 Tax=Calothrix parasitica NIES-267 TaxID=1973488 RepID=A0A1Z4M2B4_9CYAN|nr:hypothetical protein NIES267_71310 [Calothrix parasitica NIES-267]
MPVKSQAKAQPTKSQAKVQSVNLEADSVSANLEPVFNKLIGFEESQKNRLIIVTGDKGGVGKSTFARGLLHTYQSRQESPIVFEADKSNPQVKRFYGNSGLTIEETDITNANKLDAFIDKLEVKVKDDNKKNFKENVKILMDLPAQSNRFFFEFIKDMNLFEILQERLKIRTTVVIVLSRVKDCIFQLESLYKIAGESVDYLIVKNGFFGEEEDFRRYNDSEIRKQIFEENNCICEISMPELIEHAFDYIDELTLTFDKAIQPGNRISVEARTKSWVRKFESAIQPALPLLRL